jgi:hypothetical protein
MLTTSPDARMDLKALARGLICLCGDALEHGVVEAGF